MEDSVIIKEERGCVIRIWENFVFCWRKVFEGVRKKLLGKKDLS